MTGLESYLKSLLRSNSLGLMTHAVIGYPSLSKTEVVVNAMIDSGVDLIELQIPCVSPYVSGTAIMRACEKSLKNGTSIKSCLNMMEKLSKTAKIPLLFMGHYNSLFCYGVKDFVRQAKNVGCSGLIIPDIPPEEEADERFIYHCNKNRIHHIRFLSPVSTDERIKKNVEIANGFIYCASRQGTPGEGFYLNSVLKNFLGRVKSHTNLPLAVGFGILEHGHVEALRGLADIAVIGTRIIELLKEHSFRNSDLILKKFIKKIKLR